MDGSRRLAYTIAKGGIKKIKKRKRRVHDAKLRVGGLSWGEGRDGLVRSAKRITLSFFVDEINPLARHQFQLAFERRLV